MKIAGLFFSVFFLFNQSLFSQTYVNGNVSGTWTKANSPYIVEDTIVILSGETLTIEPGVEIKFKSNGQLWVYGTLDANGDEADSVYFTHYTDHPDSTWKGITIYEADSCVFKYCVIKYAYESENKGGAIYIYYTNLLIENCYFEYNKARYEGGAICSENGSMECFTIIKNSCFVNNNSIYGTGGAIACGGANNLELINCRFENNIADDYGGAVYNDLGFYDNYKKIIVINCTFKSNNANSGGAIFARNYAIINSIFIDNYASWGSSLSLESDGQIINSIFQDMYKYDKTISIHFDYNVTIRNSILRNMTFYSQYGQLKNLKLEYCNVEGGWEGEGNIDFDPMFVDPTNGDFHLQPGSPCINTGSPSAFYVDSDGTRNDMGIYGGTGLTFNTQNVDFGPAGIGQTQSYNWILYNYRDNPFTINNGTFSDNMNFSSEQQYTLTIPPMSSDTLGLKFHPNSSGNINGQLTFQSNDFITGDTASISLHGVGNVFLGEVSGTWQKINSPYIIGGNITIPQDQTLIIEPGVEVFIDTTYGNNDIEILVNGNLIAQGTISDSIIFSPKPGQKIKGIWKGIWFSPPDEGYNDKQFELEYCRISYAQNALNLNTENPIINNCTISQNSLSGILWNGIYEFYVDKHGQITNNKIFGNDQYGIYCHAHCSYEYGWAQPVIINNLITDNLQGGLFLHAEGGSVSSTNIFNTSDHAYLRPTIEQNIISNNGGYGIDCYSNGRYTTIISNIKHYSRTHVEPVISYNTITKNENTLRLRSTVYPDYTVSYSNVNFQRNTCYNNNGDQLYALDSMSNIYVGSNIFWNYVGNNIRIENQAHVIAEYNDFGFTQDGLGNISSDPAFNDPLNDDFTLKWDSPCIDAASPDSTKDPDSTRADMGAYYYHQSLSNFSLSNPVNNNLITTVQPIFNWNSSVPSGEEPIKYNLYFSKSMSFADSLTKVVQNITNDNYALPDPLDDYTEYYWKVLAKNPWSLEKWSNETWKFSVNTDTLAPEISDLPVISFNEDDSVTVLNSTWYPYVHDVATDDSLLIYEITPGKNVAVTQIDKGYLLKAKVNWFGLDTLQLKVTDFGNLNSKSPLIVDVKSVNDLPEFIGLPDSLSFFGDTTFSFIIWDYVNDIETSDSLLIYSFQAETDSLLINFESTTGTVELSSSGFIGTTKLFLTATDDSLASVSDTIFVTVKKSITSIADINDLIPNEYILFQNYPNPFNPTTTLTFGLPEPSFVKIEIFNMLGQKVLSLYEGEKSAGYHKIVWNAQAYSSGIYIYRLIAKGNKNITLIKRMILLK